MPDTPQLTNGPEVPLLDKPREEKLLEEIENLRKQLEQERSQRNGAQKKKPSKPVNRKKVWLFVIFGALLILAAFLIGFLPHYIHERQLRAQTAEKEKFLTVVNYVVAKPSPRISLLDLPGTMQAITEAPILARADGFLSKRYADIGDRVHEGQLLAEISAPDLDQQVNQAQSQLQQLRATLQQSISNLEQGRANQELAKVTAERYGGLLIRGAVSRQENDQQQTAFQAQTANVAALEHAISAARQNIGAGEANLERLRSLQAYEKVRAPFTGVITLRNVDVGALINTGNTLLYRIAATDRLRTYIYVPEPNAPYVQTGQPADLYVMEFPGRAFHGVITRTASSMDPTTRTMLTEVQVPNPTGILLPGTYATVTLNSTRSNPPIMIPGDALMVESNGTFVAVLENQQPAAHPSSPQEQQGSPQKGSGKQNDKGPQGQKAADKSDKKESPKQAFQQQEKQQQDLPTFTVHLVRVNIGRDYGNDIEVVNGLKEGELIVANPNDAIVEGAKVKGTLSSQAVGAETQAGSNNTNENTEKMAPLPGEQPPADQPAKERTDRGPGY